MIKLLQSKKASKFSKNFKNFKFFKQKQLHQLWKTLPIIIKVFTKQWTLKIYSSEYWKFVIVNFVAVFLVQCFERIPPHFTSHNVTKASNYNCCIFRWIEFASYCQSGVQLFELYVEMSYSKTSIVKFKTKTTILLCGSVEATNLKWLSLLFVFSFYTSNLKR